MTLARPANVHHGRFDGPIRVSSNGRHFVSASGEPFFWLGDTGWPLVTHYTPDEVDRYLEDRAAKGFTVVQAVLAWGKPDETIGFQGTRPGPNHAGHLPWLGSAAEPNPAYFENVDRVVAKAERLGIVLALLPIWGNFVNDLREVDVATAYANGRWTGARYRDRPNLVWMNGGDREGTGFEDVWRALAHGLRDGDEGRHLITFHPCGPRSSSYFFHEDDWLGFNMAQIWTEWTRTYATVMADYVRLPTKPIVMAEGAYEEGPEYPMGPVTPLLMRRQAWWSLMAGGFYTYGHAQMWRQDPGWLDKLDAPGARHMKVYRDIATSRPWWRMIPDQSIFGIGQSSGRTLNASMRTLDRTCAIVYLSEPCHFVLYLERVATPRVKATWVDPRSGDTRDGGTFTTGNPPTVEVLGNWTTQCFQTPPLWEDAVLVLDGIE